MSTATLKFIRVSPNKARLVAREVQGMNAEKALAALEFMPNKAAGIISKVIASAVANGDFEPEEVTITSCRVDKAAVMKRWRPRARGTATRILKPTAHIFVEVADEASVAKVAEEKATQKAPIAKEAKKSTKKAEAKAEAKKAAEEADKKADEKASKSTKSTKTETAKTVAKTAPKATTGAKSDDLTKIKGIGKVYQSKLNSEGIYSFADLANMSKEQIATMEEKYSFKGDFMDSIADAKNFVNGKDA